ncbi:ABC transporter ATP-binding protein [Methanocella sp. MCL-LM]|uniref:ABC transporter ATP-binding protein n=1 Tax=Methanocella sp. MCL-LM TaxID=3412035 RepID=UPI003C763EF6
MKTVKEAYNYLKEALFRTGRRKTNITLKDLVFFFQFLKPLWTMAALSLILAFIAMVVKSMAPLGGKVLIDFILLKQGYGQIEQVLAQAGLQSVTPEVIRYLGSIDMIILSMIIFSIIFGSLELIRSYISMKYGQELTFSLQKTLFDRVLRFPMAQLKEKQTGYLVARISSDVGSIQAFFSGTVTQVMSNVFFILMGTVILYLISPKITLIILLIAPLYGVVNYLFSSRIRSVSYRLYETSSQVYKHMQETLSGAEVVKTNTAEDRELEKVSQKMRTMVHDRMISYTIMTASSTMLRAVQFVVVLVILWLGTREVQNGIITVGDFAAFCTYAYLLSGSINGLFSTLINIQPTLTSMDRLKEMFDIVPEYRQDDSSKLRPDKVNGEIRFEHVSFAYEANKPVVKDASFTIKAGETVTLIGQSGLGKTTIASLLLKFYTPQEGAIYLDGHDLKDIDTLWLREQIGFVSQDIFLFDDTIANNIRYGKPSASFEEVIRAAKAAGIHESVEKFPEGYETIVGERGAKLSTGQRQRVSIARAFLRNTPILVMDEPTSALDMETEDMVKEALGKLVKGRTVFIISHRMSMTEIADRVLVVNEEDILENSSARIPDYVDGIKVKAAQSE